MYYEINVSLNGKHLFATAERSITTLEELKKVYYFISSKFTYKQGFQINVTQWDKTGVTIASEVLELIIKN